MTDQFFITNLRAALRSVLEADEDLEVGADDTASRESVVAAAKRARQKLSAARWAIEHVLDRAGHRS